MRILRSLVPFVFVTLAACGGGDGGNTQPVAVAASVTLAQGATVALVSIGDTRTLTATVKDAAQATITSAPVTWTTSNAAVATVQGTGSSAVVTAVGNGSATITAASGAVQASVPVDVAQRLSTLAVNTPAAMSIGATTTLQVSARDARNTPIAGVTGATFATSDRSKALVSAAGLVTAVAPGSATITVTLVRDGVTANGTSTITVAAPISPEATAAVSATSSNSFTPATVTVRVGGSVAYSFSGDHNVIFSGAGAPADVPVTNSGTVNRTFLTAGTYNYTCSLHAGMNGSVLVAAPSIFAQMNGANERPNANPSTANGAALFTRTGATVNYTVTYQGIASVPTGLHIHAPASTSQTSGIIVDLVTTPLTGSSGVLTGTFTATNIRSIAGQPPISMDSLMVLMQNGAAYVNVHSTVYPGGEIRGQTGAP
ncbi:MAG: CHRD domain-containing protein [Gemmatimonadaceae bacterium]|nr:CHRD domain-containing protein [Gemmatimonadaceae bacterium]